VVCKAISLCRDQLRGVTIPSVPEALKALAGAALLWRKTSSWIPELSPIWSSQSNLQPLFRTPRRLFGPTAALLTAVALLVHKVFQILQGQLTTNATKDCQWRVLGTGFRNNRKDRMRGKSGVWRL